jgi:formate-dependent nitrite reductase membrane component NrfD
MPAEVEHFSVSPDWKWYILFYFFLAGLAGGAYAIAALMRLVGDDRDRVAARAGFVITFLALVVCPVLLILDLGSPSRFWHMLINTTPDQSSLNFRVGSPMSIGVWGVTVFAAFSLVSFAETLVLEGVRLPLGGALVRIMSGVVGRAVMIVGALLGLFVASYTGVLIAVSNQPVWSDTWTLGGLFLASGMSAAAVLISVVSRLRSGQEPTEGRLTEAEGYFAAIEVLFVVLFWVTLANAGRLGTVLANGWVLLWIFVLVSLLPALIGLTSRTVVVRAGSGGMARAVRTLRAATPAAAAVVLLGVLALRVVVLFSPQS